MKRVFRSLLFLMIAFSLTWVVAGNALTFHLHEESFSYTQESSFHETTEMHDSAANCEHQDFDPCASGHCHLGHCAVLLSLAHDLNLPAEDSLLYLIRNSFPLNRFLESPFQPPKHCV